MISNPAQRDGTDGTAASASAESYRERRQGNLQRASDGFRSPSPSTEPRRPFEGGHKVDPPMAPYRPNPRPPETVISRHPPRNFGYLRAPDLGAPRVNFPDAERTRGRLQHSGEAWGHIGERARAQLTPAVDGRNAPPSHALGENRVGSASAMGPRWRDPISPTIRGRKPGASTAM